MIYEKLLPINKYSRPGRNLAKVLGVVIHYVGVNFQRAEQTVSYFDWLKKGEHQTFASAHYVIDLDGDGIRCVPDNEVAYHCGAKVYKDGIQDKLGNYPNYTTIGIEMCHTNKGFTEETIETTAKLTAQILIEHDLDINNLYRHYDITGKICPKFFVNNESLWEEFKNKVQSFIQ